MMAMAFSMAQSLSCYTKMLDRIAYWLLYLLMVPIVLFSVSFANYERPWHHRRRWRTWKCRPYCTYDDWFLHSISVNDNQPTAFPVCHQSSTVAILSMSSMSSLDPWCCVFHSFILAFAVGGAVHNGNIQKIAFSPDGRYLTTGGLLYCTTMIALLHATIILLAGWLLVYMRCWCHDVYRTLIFIFVMGDRRRQRLSFVPFYCRPIGFHSTTGTGTTIVWMIAVPVHVMSVICAKARVQWTTWRRPVELLLVRCPVAIVVLFSSVLLILPR